MSRFGWAALLAGVAAACSGGGLVGGECRPGACEGSAGAAEAGEEAGELDGSAEAAPPDAAPPAWDAADAGSDAPSLDGAGVPEAGGGDAQGAADVEPIACEPPLVLCEGACIDVGSDPENCGACGLVCPSGLCANGACVGATKGHVVLLCASYEQTFQASPQTALLGNAVFLTSANPVRIMGYVEHTPVLTKNRVNQTVQWAAAAKGRSYGITAVSSAADVAAKLDPTGFDVLLVYDQQDAPPGVLASVGSLWASKLASFVSGGGVVVVASGGGGSGEVHALVQNAALLPVSAQPPVTGSILEVSAATDAVGLNVLSPFAALKQSCTWETSASEGPGNVFVVRVSTDAGPGAPAVIHKAF